MAVGDDIAAKLRRFHELRVARDEAKAAKDRAEAEYREYEAELWDELNDSPLVGAFKIDLGGDIGVVSFQAKETYYGRILDADKALEALDSAAMKDEMTKTEIVKQRLHELVRERLDNAQPMPEGIDWTARRFISISNQKD